MIHNQEVNGDLQKRGILFLMDTEGRQLFPWEDLKKDDIMIIPAFGTTLAIEKNLQDLGLDVVRYNTTCPFVERVWTKSERLGKENYTIIVHGKHNHEETRATFSRSEIHGPSLVVKDIHEARQLGKFMLGQLPLEKFQEVFRDRVSKNFNPSADLNRIGVINQTTMLASETQEIADFFRDLMAEKYGPENLVTHFADTRDTLCYATNENQLSTLSLLESDADLAIVVGGYNSSNTSHIVELCEKKLPTFFINSEREIITEKLIRHFDFHLQQIKETSEFIPSKNPIRLILTSGASCPDAVIDRVLDRIIGFFPETRSKEEVLAGLED